MKHAAIAAALCLPLIQGCVAWEIRDGVRTANQRMREIDDVLIDTTEQVSLANERIASADERIAQSTAEIERVRTSLDDTRQRLDAVITRLDETQSRLALVTGSLDATNPLLELANQDLERMRILTEILASLRGINEALLPLGRTMQSLDGTLAFFGLGDDAQDEAPAPADAAVAPPAADAATPPSPAVADAAPARSINALVGTWVVRAHPAATPSGETVLVILGSGRFLRTMPDGAIREGVWTREGSALTLAFDPDAGQGEPVDPSATLASKFEIVNLSARVLTLRAGQSLLVLTRP